MIPQIPRKPYYICSLQKVPEEAVRGGLILIARLIIIFI